MKEWDRLHKEYTTAKKAYDAAERVFLAARADLTRAERDRTTEWRKLVQAAEVLPAEVRKRVAAEQFGTASLPNDDGG
jgi:hypothetical protein